MVVPVNGPILHLLYQLPAVGHKYNKASEPADIISRRHISCKVCCAK